MKKFNGMTAYEHSLNGKIVCEIKNSVHELLNDCGTSFGSSNRATRYARSLLDNLVRLQSALDDEYCKVATKEDFEKYKYPYYMWDRREK